MDIRSKKMKGETDPLRGETLSRNGGVRSSARGKNHRTELEVFEALSDTKIFGI